MRKPAKAILFFVVVLIVLVIVGVLGMTLFADRAVKAAVESAGTRTLNVRVAVAQAGASLLRGSMDLRSIRIANPPDYEGPLLLKLDTVHVTAEPASLLRDEIHIRDMRLDGMEVFVEQRGLRNNLYEVIRPLREPETPTGRTLLIDRLTIADITVHIVVATLPGQPPAQPITLKVAPITMTDLGRDERMDTAVLIGRVLLAVAAGVADQAGGILPRETLGEITGLLDKAIDLGRTIFGPRRTGNQQSQ